MGQPTKKLTHEQFCHKAIESLRTGEYKGIHTVFSGFNDAFREYFDGANPVDATKALVAKGKLVSRPVKRGAVIYKPGEEPEVVPAGPTTLAAMGLLKA